MPIRTQIRGTSWSKRLAHLQKMRMQAWRAPITSVALNEALLRNEAVCTALGLNPDATTHELLEAVRAQVERAQKRWAMDTMGLV